MYMYLKKKKLEHTILTNTPYTSKHLPFRDSAFLNLIMGQLYHGEIKMQFKKFRGQNIYTKRK